MRRDSRQSTPPMSQRRFERYRKTHPVDHPLDAEEAKVRRELADLAKLRGKERARTRRQTHALGIHGLESDAEIDVGDVQGQLFERSLRSSARVHKHRLKEMLAREADTV